MIELKKVAWWKNMKQMFFIIFIAMALGLYAVFPIILYMNDGKGEQNPQKVFLL
jgi:hypothetical protein